MKIYLTRKISNNKAPPDFREDAGELQLFDELGNARHKGIFLGFVYLNVFPVHIMLPKLYVVEHSALVIQDRRKAIAVFYVENCI